MARFFLILAILLTLMSGVLSIQTRSRAKQKVEELTTAKTTIVAVSGERDTARKAMKLAEEKAADATAKKEQVETQLAAAKNDAEKATKDLAEAKTQLETVTKDRDDVKDKLAKASAAPAATPNPEVETKLKEALAQLEEKKQVETTLQAKAKDAEAKAKSLEQAETQRQAKIMKKGLEGHVLAVNPNWNFVVLSMGDHQGVLPDKVFIVQRGGAMVAKVRITSVEPATSIADIVPGTASKGFGVQPGDVVIYRGDDI